MVLGEPPSLLVDPVLVCLSHILGGKRAIPSVEYFLRCSVELEVCEVLA